ncbi:MAG: dicarboxylate/amino acid:cation symporter [Muribaculaceae bacterium]|nr:dicarboxylate/amino acid:cation symporter [Muribaculaceae bacterium]
MRKVFGNLLVRILIAMVLGIGAAYVLPLWGVRVFETFNSVFSQFLGFMIPLIIFGFVAPAIADVGKGAGKMLVATALIAYAATVIAGTFSYIVSDAVFPSLIAPDSAAALESAGGEGVPSPYFTIGMPPLMSVMGALILSFILGIGCSRIPQSPLKRVLDDFGAIVARVIGSVVIPLLPVYIFGIFLNMTFSGKVATVLLTFSQIILVIFALHIAILLLQFTVASFFSTGSRNPLRLLCTMLPAYFTALGTQSSAATIPVTLRQTKALGVRDSVAGFTVPLCATIHMSGSTLKIVACAVALMILNGLPFDFPMFFGFICMLGITIIAAPGIPGGAIMASLGLLTSMLGFSDADCALMIALYIAMDSFGTACNVTGDGALSIIVNRLFPEKS